ncbi:ABC transporter ATP-binding protein [Frankia sp. CiP3]|uniref:ABC transporter ATP-binding protein n=1 Tax=Frankia sp. CiP3 TaxID=2880971 RepID=UPI001EF52D69|nr:ABC transporter ATP-binding protein [Frankia sp. CiP3]
MISDIVGVRRADESITQPASLILHNVTKRYGEISALAGVDVAVVSGRMTGLLGPNGAGKTTLMAIAAGVLESTSGDVAKAPGLSVGYLPQQDNVYPMLTARENLRFVARAQGLPRRGIGPAVDEALAGVHLHDRADERASTFSGGMRRRLGFAAALIGDPTVLLLDEPTAGVDPQARALLLDLVRAQVESGKAVLYSTHLLAEIESYADDLYVLHKGSVLAHENVPDLLRSYARRTIFVTVDGDAAPLCAVLRLEPDTTVTAAPRMAGVERVRVTTSADRAHAVGRILSAAAFTASRVVDIESLEPNLESVFLNITGREVRD